MMRLMLSIAELVCSVANARWPVSAIVNAAPIVSKSRISPISTTSGSWRSAYLSAAWKLLVSVPTSRWLTMHAWWRWMNSIGSSTVMMWPFSSLLILSIIAARVVLLPEPVGPVTSTRPRARDQVEVGSVPLDHLLEERAEVDWHCFLSLSGSGFFDDFFERRDTLLDLQHAVHAQRQHPFLDREIPQLFGGCPLQDLAP